MRFSTLALALLCATPAAASGDAGYEWGGIFDVSAYTSVQWIAQKVEGDYADPAMNFVITAHTDGTHETLEGVEEASETLLAGTPACTVTTVAGTIAKPTSTGVCYKLTFDATSFETVWTIDVTGVTFISLYAEHVPTEFEDTTHYLRGIDGTDIEPLHEMPEVPEPEKPWALVILSCALVNLMTFCGVALLACKIIPSKITPTTHGCLSGFASGALLACAVYLILVEAMHLIGTAHDEEVEVIWRWGTAVLGGFLISLFLFLLEPGKLIGCVVSTKSGDDHLKDGEVDNALATTLFSVCIGDFAHNLVDGFAIGFAFKMCDHSLAWGILAATMYHEIAQEIGDFCLLTHDVGLSVKMALFWNFMAGTSVIIGGVIITGVDISDEVTGLLLAFGGGTYLYLATSEALPRALGYSAKLEDKSGGALKQHYAAVLASFILGAVLIGLVLIKHEHCVPGGGAHAH